MDKKEFLSHDLFWQMNSTSFYFYHLKKKYSHIQKLTLSAIIPNFILKLIDIK